MANKRFACGSLIRACTLVFRIVQKKCEWAFAVRDVRCGCLESAAHAGLFVAKTEELTGFSRMGMVAAWESSGVGSSGWPRQTLPIYAVASVQIPAVVAGIQTCRQGRAGKELKVAAVETTNNIVAIVIL